VARFIDYCELLLNYNNCYYYSDLQYCNDTATSCVEKLLVAPGRMLLLHARRQHVVIAEPNQRQR